MKRYRVEVLLMRVAKAIGIKTVSEYAKFLKDLKAFLKQRGYGI